MKWLKVRLSKAKEWIVEKWKVALIAVVAFVLVIFVLLKGPEYLVRGYRGRLDASAISKLTPQELIQLQKDLISAENNARATFAQILGGLALLFGLYLTYRNVKVAHKNVEVAEEGKLTERFSKAVELLGNDKLDIRLGGIYALERIARDSLKDHWTVMEVLTAFVRERTKNEYKEIADAGGNITLVAVESKPNITVEVQAALTVIGRRMWTDQERPRQKINLMGSFLRGTVLFDANLRDANLCNTILTQSILSRTDLRKAILFNANLIEADLSYTKLNDTLLDYAKLHGADLSKSIGPTWEQISKAIIDEKTKLPPEVEKQHRAEQSNKTE